MSYIRGLRCKECGRTYPAEALYVCEWCFGSLEIEYDYSEIKNVLSRDVISSRDKNMWRYRELLPLQGPPQSGLYSGFTPLLRADRLARKLGVEEVYVKDDSVNHPTLSFKDRVVAVAISKAREFGFDTVACASTGNLAHSVSAQSAASGLQSFIFVPVNLEMGKIIACSIHAPKLIAVEGNYDEVNRLCTEIASNYRWAFVNINIRPYYAEGSKTYGFEIAEQLGWRLPEHIVVPVAGGSLISKIWKGLCEFHILGLIDKPNTRIHAAQAAGCAPVAHAIKEEADIITPVKPNTIAKSLAIGNPADGYYAVKTVRETGGYAGVASDEEIIEAIKLLAETEGIFTEPAGGVTVAVAKKLIEEGKIARDESLVICITGNGLKTQEVVSKHLRDSIKIKPTLKSFEESSTRVVS